MTRIQLLVIAFLTLVFIDGCTKKQPNLGPAETSITKIKESPEPSTAVSISPSELAAQKKCNEAWAAAAEAYRKFEDKSNAANFKVVSDSIPKPIRPLSRCDNQNVIIKALDYNMDELSKNSGNVFDFTVFLAKIAHIGDGAIALVICEQGPLLLKKDTTNFLKALKQEHISVIRRNCFVTSAFEYVDMLPEQIRKGLQSRIDLLNKVHNQDLKEIKDELIGAINSRISQL